MVNVRVTPAECYLGVVLMFWLFSDEEKQKHGRQPQALLVILWSVIGQEVVQKGRTMASNMPTFLMAKIFQNHSS